MTAYHKKILIILVLEVMVISSLIVFLVLAQEVAVLSSCCTSNKGVKNGKAMYYCTVLMNICSYRTSTLQLSAST